MQKVLDYITTGAGLVLAVAHGLYSLPTNPTLENWAATIGLAILGFFGFKNTEK
jgi:hypothetical protein